MDKNLCVIFPGMGYHSDKPLLYYSKNTMMANGFEIIDVNYGNLPKEIAAAYEQGWDAAVRMLRDMDFGRYDRIVFLSKSIGTVIAARYAAEYVPMAENIYFTPLEQTMQYAKEGGIAFHGTADPLADTEKLKKLCAEKNVVLYTYEGGNHSIETEDILWNIRTQEDIAEKYIDYLNFWERQSGSYILRR